MPFGPRVTLLISRLISTSPMPWGTRMALGIRRKVCRASFGSALNRKLRHWARKRNLTPIRKNGGEVASNQLAFVFPGQGSQHIGMGKEFTAEFKLTENTQPGILTASIAALRVLETETPLRPSFVAGHSLGEYSALVAVGALQFRDAVKIVRERGRLMQEAVPSGQGAMAVVLGLEM